MFCEKADLFFKDPRTPPDPPGHFGVLYLLRRDISICMGVDPNTGASTSHKTLWPAAMAMLAGVDLLGKFQSGEDESASVGKRFKDFIKQNAMNLGDQDCETLYHLRNALLHSFGLYSKSKHREYHFLLTCKPDQPLITELPEPKCQVDLQALNGTFRAMTARYRERLEQDGTLQKNFNDMFAKYGQISILPAPTDDNVLGGYNTSSF